METFDLKKFKEIWQTHPVLYSSNPMIRSDIRSYLKGKSKGTVQRFKNTFLFDIVIKFVLTLSFIGLFMIFYNQPQIQFFIAALLLIAFTFLLFQWNLVKRISQFTLENQPVRDALTYTNSFYYSTIVKGIYIAAATNVLVILSGSFYYFFFTYQTIPAFQPDDYFVFSGLIILAYFPAVLFQLRNASLSFGHLTKMLENFDDEQFTMQEIIKNNKRQFRTVLLASIAILMAVLFFGYVVFM